MRKLMMVLLVLPLLSLAQERKFQIKGKIESDTLSNGIVTLGYNTHGEWRKDTVEIKNNSYVINGKMEDYAMKATLTCEIERKNVKRNDWPFYFATVYLEPGYMEVYHEKKDLGIVSTPVVKGSATQADYILLQNQMNAGKDIVQTLVHFAETHPSSWLNVNVLNQIIGILPLEKTESLINNFSDSLKRYQAIKDLQKVVAALKKTQVGSMAADFTQNDVSGKPVTLSSFLGKYVLVDFWASWCKPCRAENPNVLKAYNKYKDKGFEVLGVSLDEEKARDKWLKAIKDDKLPWAQVSDLKGWKNEAGLKYGVKAIPMSILIDPQGRIIAKNIRGEELDEKLAELFN